jgi:hypothetical protein
MRILLEENNKRRCYKFLSFIVPNCVSTRFSIVEKRKHQKEAQSLPLLLSDCFEHAMAVLHEGLWHTHALDDA